MADGFDAFISYSRADAEAAAAIERHLRRFACPWYRRRSFHLFRDSSILSAAASLSRALEVALERSRFLIVLASPAAASSSWVDREIACWLTKKAVSSIILVRLAGRLPWGREAVTSADQPALPPALERAYAGEASEPLYIDLTGVALTSPIRPAARQAIGRIAARLKGVDLDDMLGEDLRVHRRAKRAASAVAVAFVALAVGGVVAYRQAVHERAAKQEHRTVALSRHLAGLARSELQRSALRPAALICIAALRTRETDEAYGAILDTLVASISLSLEFQASETPIGAIALSPDAHTLVTGNNAGDIAFWGLPGGTRRRRVANVHPGGVSGIALTPDGSMVATAGPESDVALWQIDELVPKPVAGLRAFSVSIPPPGRYLLTGADNGRVTAWSLTGDEPIVRAHAGDGTIVDLAFDASGQHLVSGSLFGAVRLWSLPDLRDLRRFDPAPATGAYVDITADGHTVAMAGGHSVKLWDVTDDEPYGDPLQSPSEGVGMTRFLGAGRDVAVLAGQNVFSWSAVRRRLGFHQRDIHSLVVDRARRILVTGSVDGLVRLWSLLPRNAFVKAFDVSSSSLYPDALALSADGRYLAVGTSDRRWDFVHARLVSERAEIHVFDIEQARPVGRPHVGHRGTVTALVFSPDGTRIASGSVDGTVRTWTLGGADPELTVAGEPGHDATAVGFLGPELLAIAFRGEPARLVDRRGATVATSRSGAVAALDIGAGHRLWLGMANGEIRRWTPDDGSETVVWSAPTPALPINALRVDAAGTAVVVLRGGKLERIELDGRSRTVTDLAATSIYSIAAGPHWAITAAANEDIVAWNLGTGRSIASLHSGNNGVIRMPAMVAAATSSDRVAAVIEGVPMVFDLSAAALVARACEVAVVPLSAKDRRDLELDDAYDDPCAHR